jgi:hypothetical protein
MLKTESKEQLVVRGEDLACAELERQGPYQINMSQRADEDKIRLWIISPFSGKVTIRRRCAGVCTGSAVFRHSG